MVVCNDVSFCMNFNYNAQSGTCTLFMDPGKREFVQLEKSCPRTPVSNWVVSMDQDAEKWAIECPDPALKSAPPPSADMLDGLE